MSMGFNSLIVFCLCLQWPPLPRSAAQLKAKGRQFAGVKQGKFYELIFNMVRRERFVKIILKQCINRQWKIGLTSYLV